jgi:hypothetical protein
MSARSLITISAQRPVPLNTSHLISLLKKPPEYWPNCRTSQPEALTAFLTAILQRTDVGKYSFVNRTIKSWNQLPARLLASFPCKLNTFTKRVKNVVTSKGFQVGVGCKYVKWCEV